MIQIKFTDKIIERLHYLRFNHPHPRVRQRMEVLFLKSQKMKHGDIVKYASVAPNTVTGYLKIYKKGGIEALEKIKFHKPKSGLHKHYGTLKEYFEKNPPASLKAAGKAIKELTNMERSLPQIYTFLLGIGMKCRKAGGVPAKANTEAQEEFKKNIWIFA